MSQQTIFSFDVESIGLHGEGYAAGYVVLNEDGDEIEARRYACDPAVAIGTDTCDADRAWVSANCPSIEATHDLPDDVRDAFWSALQHWMAKGAIVVADCAWPVEARFLARAALEHPGQSGPYPLHDVATMLLAAGMDPLATYDRRENELPKHDPLADARQSARLWREAMSRITVSA